MLFPKQDPAYSQPVDQPSLLLTALLISLVIHVLAGGLFFGNWHRLPIEPPRPLTVTVASPPPPRTEAVGQSPRGPRQVERPPTKAALRIPAIKPVPEERAPSPSAVVVERADPIPPPVAATPETAPAPPASVKLGATPAPVLRAEQIEPPSLNAAYLNNPRPVYPPIARKRGLEGVVVLRVQVSAGGAPERVAVAKSSGAAVLDEAALKAVQGWTFVPARRGDTAIAYPVDVPIRFQLTNAGG